jgi:hypothetical protein
MPRWILGGSQHDSRHRGPGYTVDEGAWRFGEAIDRPPVAHHDLELPPRVELFVARDSEELGSAALDCGNLGGPPLDPRIPGDDGPSFSRDDRDPLVIVDVVVAIGQGGLACRFTVPPGSPG